MFAKLLLFFTIVPIAELTLLIWVGGMMGVWPTVALVLITAFLGSFLARRQGLNAWRQLQTDLAQGKMPQDAFLDGIAVLIAGVLLITPGVLSDLSGILLMIPACRRPLKTYLKKRFLRSISSGSARFIEIKTTGGGQKNGPARQPFGGSPFAGSPFDPGPRFEDNDVIDMSSRPSTRGEA